MSRRVRESVAGAFACHEGGDAGLQPPLEDAARVHDPAEGQEELPARRAVRRQREELRVRVAEGSKLSLDETDACAAREGAMRSTSGGEE